MPLKLLLNIYASEKQSLTSLHVCQGKNKALADAGAIVPDSFEAFEGAIARTFKKLVDEGKLVPQSNPKAPTLPLDLEAAKKSGTVRLPIS